MTTRSRPRLALLLPLLLTLLLTLLPATALCGASSVGETRALLALDKTLSGPLVASRNVTIVYTIHNVGEGEAHRVNLKDLSYPSSRFVVSTPARKSWEKLEAGAFVTHRVDVVPLRSGQLYVTPPSVSYQDDDHATRVSRLAVDDAFVVEDLVDFRRRTDTHAVTWAIFLAAASVLGVAPLAVSSFIVSGLTKRQ